MNTSGLPPGLAREPQSLLDSVNGDALRRDAPKDSLRQTDGPLYTSVTIPVPKEIQYAISVISSTLDKLAGPVERHHLVPIVIVVCVETAFLKWIRRSNEDVLSTIFFTFLLGSFAWPVWSNLKHIHCRLDDVYGKIEVLQQSMDVLVVSPKANAVDDLHPSREIIPVPSSIDPVSAPAIPEVPFVPPREDHPTSKSLVSPVVKAVDAEPPRPAVDRLVDSNKPPYPPHEIPETIPVHSFNDPVSAPATPKVPFVLPRENPPTPKSLVNPVVKAVDPEPPRPAVDLLVDSNKTPYPSHEIPETIPVHSFSDPVSVPATPKVPLFCQERILPRQNHS
ncbi:hypothetical protein F5148DRAFT_745824 [Russula earlei]|uniref:Uncharacterized protein n=1 Tax=Russula earlei TaxID=71964 RepID=A0ACC0UDV5_9AGAM|nr:hypothetical protein F5148DRAFT_745824 [Russula earlei]